MSNFKSSLINDLATARLGQPGGFAKLDENGLVTPNQLPVGSGGGSLSWVEGTRATNPMNPFASIPAKLDSNGNPYVWKFNNSGPVSLDGTTVISVFKDDRIWYHLSDDSWKVEKAPDIFVGSDLSNVGKAGLVPFAQQNEGLKNLSGNGQYRFPHEFIETYGGGYVNKIYVGDGLLVKAGEVYELSPEAGGKSGIRMIPETTWATAPLMFAEAFGGNPWTILGQPTTGNQECFVYPNYQSFTWEFRTPTGGGSSSAPTLKYVNADADYTVLPEDTILLLDIPSTKTILMPDPSLLIREIRLVNRSSSAQLLSGPSNPGFQYYDGTGLTEIAGASALQFNTDGSNGWYCTDVTIAEIPFQNINDTNKILGSNNGVNLNWEDKGLTVSTFSTDGEIQCGYDYIIKASIASVFTISQVFTTRSEIYNNTLVNHTIDIPAGFTLGGVANGTYTIVPNEKVEITLDFLNYILVSKGLSSPTVAEYGEQVLGSGVTVPTTSTSPTIATDIMSFTLPSAGTWDVDFIVRAATFSVNTSGANGMAVVITDNLNNVIANTELKVGRESLASVDAINIDLQFSATGKAQITTTSATTYKVRGYHDGSGGSTGSWTAQSDNNGRTKVSWKKIAGQLPAIMPTTVSGGIAFGNGTQLIQDAPNLFYNNVSKRLGIGTNAPTSKVQVVSTTTANVTGEPLLKLSSNYGAGLLPGAGGSLLFTDEFNTNVSEVRSLTQNPNNVELAFSTFGGGVLSEKLRISPTGNLGVGVTSPLNKIHIGTASVANTGGIRLPITSASANQTGSAIGVDANGDIVKIASGGSSTTYIYASISSQIVIGAPSAQDILFNQVGASNGITLNGSGEFLLQGGVTYELDASCPWQVNSGTAVNGNVVYSWVDSSNNLIGTTGNVGVSSFGSNGGSTPGNGVSQNAKLIYTAPFTQNVKVRIIAGSLGGAANLSLYQRAVGYPTPYVTIKSI